MIKHFVLGTALTALATVPALAGGYTAPVIEMTPQATPSDWEGSYAGVSLGYGKGTYDQRSSIGEAGVSVDIDGALFGLHAGHNWQRGNSVYGVDIGVSSGLDGITAQGEMGPVFSCGTGDCNVDIKSLLTLRARYGMLVSSSTLFYGAVGVAVGRVDGGIFNSDLQGKSTETGYTVGIGLEHQVNARWSVFGEVDYTDLGTLKFGPDDQGGNFEADGDFSTIRMGVNYRF